MDDSEEQVTTAVVVGFDGSDASEAAVGWAATQAVLTGGRLDVVTAWEYPTSWGSVVPLPGDYDPAEDARALLAPLAARLAGRAPRTLRPHPRLRRPPVRGPRRGLTTCRVVGRGQPGARQLLRPRARLRQSALHHARRLPGARLPHGRHHLTP